MSFGDISNYPSQNRNINDSVGGDGLIPIKTKLAQFQRLCASIKELITEMRRKRVNQSEKTQLDQQIRDLRKFDSDLKLMFDQKLRTVEGDNMTKATLLRMQKDFDKLRINVESLAKESMLVRIDVGGGTGPGSRPAGFGPSVGNLLPGEDRSVGDVGIKQFQQLQQQTIFRPVLQEHDIEEMLIEERERDIRKINEDIAIVHDMFVRMADIVDDQGIKIEQIHTATETSHERAEAGLEQVKQAAAYQPTCTIS
jgi:hypothetical protein